MPSRRAFVAGGLMTGAAVLGQLRPTPHRPSGWSAIHLDAAIPRQFGKWQMDQSIVPLQPSPDVAALLDRIYTQQLSRTYASPDGQRLMLLIAYGENQLELTTQAHMPDVCYPAQGFNILQRTDALIGLGVGALPVARLVAQAPGRTEPLTYWIAMGDAVLQNEMQRRLSRISYALRGVIPDGMLVRVSTIDTDVARAYRSQDVFIRDLYSSLQPDVVSRIYGAELRTRA